MRERRDASHARDPRTRRPRGARHACSTGGPHSPGTRGRTRRASSAGGLRRSSSAAGRAPVWRLLSPQLVAERSGNEGLPADAVIVARSVASQQGPTSRLLRGFYEGLASSGVPAVGVETSRPPRRPSMRSTRRPVERRFRGHGSGTARARAAARGRPARELRPEAAATDGILPPIDAVAAPPVPGERDTDSDDPHRRTRRGSPDRRTIAAFRRELPGAVMIVADDGSRDRTAASPSRPGPVVRSPAAARVRPSRSPRGGAGRARPAL